MSLDKPVSLRPHEKGQLFAGWVVGIFIIAAMIIYVADTMRRSRNTTQSTLYRELALNVAKAGFEEGLSYFRNHGTTCYLPALVVPVSQAYVTPWPDYPDEAFLPGTSDTDFYSNITVSTDLGTGTCAGGIIGDVPMDEYVTFTASQEMTGSSLWGRYVLRRQNIRNWSPGPNTMSANTDADACHDISAVGTQSALGAGTRWSIASRGYLLRLPSPVSSTASSLLGTPAAFASNNLLSAPLSYYNKQPFLLAQARVYGELTRVNFNLPASPVFVASGVLGTVTINPQGVLIATGAYVSTSPPPGIPVHNVGGTLSPGYGTNTPTAESFAACFPGQSWTRMAKLAAQLATSTVIKGYPPAGGMGNLPVFGSPTFANQISQPAFYFFNQSVTLTTGTIEPVLSGVGLCIIQGSLDIPSGNNSNWAGILYVKGQVTLGGPTSISGIIISETGIIIGDPAAYNKATVSYDAEIVAKVESLMKDFTVDSSSIVATQF